MPDSDLALETLLAVKSDVAPDLDAELLKRCYDLQKRHQFDRDRGPSTQAMERLIEASVQKLVPDQTR